MDRRHHKPDALSGGEWQRVAISRALMKRNLLMAMPHCGHFGGPLMKWGWLFFGFAPALLAMSGGLIWWPGRVQRTGNLSQPTAGQELWSFATTLPVLRD